MKTFKSPKELPSATLYIFTYLLSSLTHPNMVCKCYKEIIFCILFITSSEYGFWLRVSTQTFVDTVDSWIKFFQI